jgi:hypothetical protein
MIAQQMSPVCLSARVAPKLTPPCSDTVE